ncbi:MAG: M14 family metallopeptidase [bacterium]
MTRPWKALKWSLLLGAVALTLFWSGTFVEALVKEYDEPWFPEGTYDPSIPIPDSVFGYPLGSKPVGYEETVGYFMRLAEVSERVKLEKYGETYEERSLYYAVISSAENMARLDEIKTSIARLADPRKLNGEGEASLLIEHTPAVAWMAYSIHGDELSNTDAALQLTYQLAAGTDSLTEKLTRELVIIVDPLQNPDGRERFLAQMLQVAGAFPNPDPQSLAHTGFWPWGRGNHYLFDLNRDWFLLVHPETRGKVEAILEWNPQLFVDSHEMGAFSTYLFSPPREPFNPNMTETLKRWWKVFARDQARAFDRYGWSYYTREWNEEWYPGYGSSWSLYTGAVGILYEQAGVDGSLVKQQDGSILTYRESVHHHFVSSMANLTTAANHRQQLLRDFYQEKKKAIEDRTDPKTFLFGPGEKERTSRFIETLLLQHIEVQVATQEFMARDVHDIWGRALSEKRLPRGTYIVSPNQPMRPLIQAILDFDLRVSDSFLIQERRELEKRKRTRFYEVTAWSVPMGYNVDAYWTAKPVKASTEPVTQIETPSGQVINPDPGYGYVFDGSSDAAVRALVMFLEEGYKIRVAEKAFKVEGVTFSRGSVLLRNQGNPESLGDSVGKVVAATGITVYGVNTALADEGPDLGGGYFRLLEPPRIGIFAGASIDFTSYGALWHLLDRRYQIRSSSLDINRIGRLNLDKYNVLVLPQVWGGPKGYERIIGKSGIAKLRTWIEQGGTLVAIGTGAAFAADTSVALSRVRLRRQVLDRIDEYEEAVAHELAATRPAVDSRAVWEAGQKPPTTEEKGVGEKRKPRLKELTREDERLRLFMPRGAILRADLDEEHWLTAGLDGKVPVILYTSYALMSKAPVQTPARLASADSLRLSGLLWPEARSRWTRTAYLTRESKGKGQIILFAGDPNFRGYFVGSARLLANALLLGPGLGARRPAPW